MAQDWYYKLLGEETGPVTFEALRELARDGHLTVDDEVRTSTSSWKQVAHVPSLYVEGTVEEPELATDMDLDMLLAPSSSMPVKLSAKREAQRAAVAAASAPPAAPVVEWYYKVLGQEMGPTSPKEIIQQIKDGSLQGDDTVRLGRHGAWQTLAQTSQFGPTVAQTRPQPEWYCRVLGQELGPMTFDELQAMAKSNSLQADDEVRHGATEPWQNADRTRGLKFSKEEVDSTASHDRTSTLVPFGEAATKREWFYEILGQQMGPISFQTMAQAVAEGTLKFEDKARRGITGAWSFVMDVPGLVSIEDKAAYLATKVEASRPKPVAPPPAPVAAAVVPVPPVAALAPAPVPVPAPATPPPPTPPRPMAPSGGYGAASPGGYGGMSPPTSRPAGFPPSFKPPKKSGGGSSFSLGDLKDKIDAKALGAIAVIVLMGLYFSYPYLSSMFAFGPPVGTAEYSEVNVFWTEIQSIHKNGDKPADWAGFKGERENEIKNVMSTIAKKTPTSDQKLLKLMETCTKTCLPGMLKGGAERKKQYDAMEKHMKAAEKLANPKKK